jgi:hypothetical protein
MLEFAATLRLVAPAIAAADRVSRPPADPGDRGQPAVADVDADPLADLAGRVRDWQAR